jgi:hypothetical protein
LLQEGVVAETQQELLLVQTDLAVAVALAALFLLVHKHYLQQIILL